MKRWILFLILLVSKYSVAYYNSFTYGNATWSYDSDHVYNNTFILSKVTVASGITEVTVPGPKYYNYGYYYSIRLDANLFSSQKELITINVPAEVPVLVYPFIGCDKLRYINIDSAHETRSSVDGVVYDKSGKSLIVVPNAINEFVVPLDVTNVWGTAFSNCKGMTAIGVESGNGYYASVDGVLYNKEITELVACPPLKESVSIPDTVTDIGSDAFSGCTNLSEVVFPTNLKNIGSSAFQGCTALTEVRLPEGVTKIGSSSFQGCTALTEVRLPESVASIGSSAFSGCSGLTEIIFPEGITYIDLYTFDGCTGLSKVVLPSTITNLDSRAFAGCNGVRSVTVPQSICSTNKLMTIFPNAYSRITDVIIADGTTTIGQYLFSSCVNLENLTIPDSVTSISADAFNNCDKLNAKLYVQQLKGVFGPEAGASVRYALDDVVQDRTIVSVTVDSDCAIDEFVLKNGKVYDCAIRIVNTADTAVQMSLPSGYVYESFVGAAPLILPPHSTNMLTITRTGDRTFLVARRQLQSIGL